MAAINTSSQDSLLFPPNPSLSPTQPTGSILLNRNDPSCVKSPKQNAQSKLAGVGKAIKSSFSIKDVPETRQATPPASTYNNRNRSISLSSTTSSTSSRHVYDARPGLRRSNSSRSPSVTFAPLPEVPMDLTRRRSITLGVAARSSLLKTQGGAAGRMGGQPGGGKSNVLMMNDEQWEQYKQDVAAKNQYA